MTRPAPAQPCRPRVPPAPAHPWLRPRVTHVLTPRGALVSGGSWSAAPPPGPDTRSCGPGWGEAPYAPARLVRREDSPPLETTFKRSARRFSCTSFPSVLRRPSPTLGAGVGAPHPDSPPQQPAPAGCPCLSARHCQFKAAPSLCSPPSVSAVMFDLG